MKNYDDLLRRMDELGKHTDWANEAAAEIRALREENRRIIDARAIVGAKP